jgi:hypothetical protein
MKMGNPQTQREILAQIDVATIPRRHWVLEQLATGSVSLRHIVIAGILIVLMVFLVSSFGSRKSFSVTSAGASSAHLSYHYLPVDRTGVLVLRFLPQTWMGQLGYMQTYAQRAGAIIVVEKVSQDQLMQLDRDIALTHPPDVMWVFLEVEGGAEFVGVTGQVLSGTYSVIVSKRFHTTILFSPSALPQLTDAQLNVMTKAPVAGSRRLIFTPGELVNAPRSIPSSLRPLCPTLLGVASNKLSVLQPWNCDTSNLRLVYGDESDCFVNLVTKDLECINEPRTKEVPKEVPSG